MVVTCCFPNRPVAATRCLTRDPTPLSHLFLRPLCREPLPPGTRSLSPPGLASGRPPITSGQPLELNPSFLPAHSLPSAACHGLDIYKEKVQHGLESWTRQAPPPPAAPAPTNHGVLSLCASAERDVTWLLTNEKETSSALAMMIG